MNEFKIGDWCTNSLCKTFQLSQDFTNEFKWNNGTFNFSCPTELWKPQEGEWCVFWDNGDDEYIVGRFEMMDMGYNNIAPLKFIATLRDK